MAYFQRRRGNQVTAYYYDKKTRKPVRLPRKETNFLDAYTDDEVRAWLDQWEDSHGREARRAICSTLSPTDELSRLRDAALEDWRLLRPFRDVTLSEYVHDFRFMEAFFVNTHGLLDVRKWSSYTGDFPAFLRHERALGIESVKKICRTLTRFGRYLAKTRVISQPWYVDAPKSGIPRTTPLKRYRTTAQVIADARSLPAPWSLVPLLGYFGPLRPEEIYALEVADFYTGALMAAQTLTHKRLIRKKLGTKLSVSITKTLTGPAVEHLVKTHYAAGVVNIWHPDGAREIAAILRTLPLGRLFPHGRDTLNHQYASLVFNKLKDADGKLLQMGAKDWSRLCGVEFRLLDMRLELAKDQFRHSSISTTQRYMRLPPGLLQEIQQDAGSQDFDDVV